MSKYFKRKNYDYSIDDNVISLLQLLHQKKSYQRWGIKKLSNQFSFEIPVVKSALACLAQNDENEVERILLNAENTAEIQPESSETLSGYAEYDYQTDDSYSTDFERFIERNGIDENQISQVYYKEQANDKVRFTIQTKLNSDEPEIENERLYKFLSNQSFSLPPVDQEYISTDTVSILNFYDAHVDKLSYTGSGGLEELQGNLKVLKQKFSELLHQDILPKKPDSIIFPIGSDFFNTNGSERSTKKGTLQQITVHWQDSFQIGVDFYRSCIDEIIKYCNIHIVDIHGNHDQDKAYYLGQVIKAVYENDDRVHLQINRDNRKYVYVNDILIGLQHGDLAKKKINKLPNVMAIEQAENWGKAKYRTWILGDIHHKEKYTTFSSVEDMGVDIQFFRPSTSVDTWHFDNYWIGARKSISAITYSDNATHIHEDEIIF